MHLGAGAAAEARVERQALERDGTEAHVRALDHVHVPRGARAEMVVADDAPDELDATDRAALAQVRHALVEDHVAPAHGADVPARLVVCDEAVQPVPCGRRRRP